MNFPIILNSAEDRLAEAIASQLVADGFSSDLALPVAVKIMTACNMGHEDPDEGAKYLKESQLREDKWWVDYWPHTKKGKAAAKRLGCGDPKI